jgi:hypothetical protein
MAKTHKFSGSNVVLSKVALQSEWTIPDAMHLRIIKYGDLERKLVACTAPKQIRKLLVELAKFNPQHPLWAINKNWYIPTDVRIVVLNLKRGFLQDFSYILLGKMNELVQRKEFVLALSSLAELRAETKRPEWSTGKSSTFKFLTDLILIGLRKHQQPKILGQSNSNRWSLVLTMRCRDLKS